MALGVFLAVSIAARGKRMPCGALRGEAVTEVVDEDDPRSEGNECPSRHYENYRRRRRRTRPISQRKTNALRGIKRVAPGSTRGRPRGAESDENECPAGH